MDFLMNSAFAQASAAGPTPNPVMQFLPFILIFFVFYFLMIRPQKKKLQQEQTFLNNLAKGDEIYTKSGILGKIAGQTDKIVTLEISDGVKIKVLKGQVAGLAQKLFEQTAPKAELAKK